MSNPQLIHRANENSSLYNTIKARNSKQNVYDYSSESNICPVARSKIIVNSQTSLSADGNQTVKFILPNFGFLEDLFLQTKFTQGDTNADTGAKDSFLVDMAGAHAWSRCRLVYQGNTVWECTPEWTVCSQYLRANHEKSTLLDAMLGSAISGAANDTLGNIEGRRVMSTIFGGCELSCPIKGPWADGIERSIDLYSLSSPMVLEVDYRSISEASGKQETPADGQKFDQSRLVCYVAELAPQELSAYQARNYAPGSVSSQLGFTTAHFQESVASPVEILTSGKGSVVKLQSISGLVRRLYVFATLDSDRASTTDRKYMNLVDIASVKLAANNQTIYELENCEVGASKINTSSGNGYHTDQFVEMYRNNIVGGCNKAVVSDTYKLYDPAIDKTLGKTSGGEFDSSFVKVINFAYNPDDYASADGSLSFSQLGQPEIEFKLADGATGAAHSLHVVAEILTINTYSTSSTGSINFKTITE